MLGAIVVTSAMALGVYAIVEAPTYGWASLHTLGFGSVAAVALAAFLALEAAWRTRSCRCGCCACARWRARAWSGR